MRPLEQRCVFSGISYGLIQSLREKHINVVDYKPKGDKQERLISQIDLFEGGSVLLPKEAPWLEDFVSELLSFPGRHDDQVDALAQGLAWRRGGRGRVQRRDWTRGLNRYRCSPSNTGFNKPLYPLEYLISSQRSAAIFQFEQQL